MVAAKHTPPRPKKSPSSADSVFRFRLIQLLHSTNDQAAAEAGLALTLLQLVEALSR